jgi:hypothetical protein
MVRKKHNRVIIVADVRRDDEQEATFRNQFERLDDDVVDGRCSFLHSLPERMYPRPRGWAR